jgi:hypothetical protein
MVCTHLVKAFTHLRIRKVSSHYILKRYTRNVRHQLQFRTSKLVTLAMAAVRACSKSRTVFDARCQRLDELRILAESIPYDIGPLA